MLSLTFKGPDLVVLELPDGREAKLFIRLEHGGHYRVQVDAPQDVRVWRGDVYRQRQAEKSRAVGRSPANP